VPINPMNLAGELRHYIEDAGTSVAIAGQELEERVRVQPALQHVLYAAYSDYLREKTDLPLPDFVRAPARSRSWQDAVGARLEPGPAPRTARGSRGHALHLGHDRQAQGLHAYALQRAGDLLSSTFSGAAAAMAQWCSRRCPCSTSPACRRG
jgi:hypothetical protein